MQLIRVAEHLGASSRRPRHPFPALMAGEPLAVYLCTRPKKPTHQPTNSTCGAAQQEIDHLCSSTTATIALQLELKVVVVVGANNVNAAEPFLVLVISSRVVVVVWASFVIAADPEIQHAYTTNDLLVLEIIDEVFSSHRPHTVPNRIVSTTRSEKSTTTRHRDANTPAAHVCRQLQWQRWSNHSKGL